MKQNSKIPRKEQFGYDREILHYYPVKESNISKDYFDEDEDEL